MLKALRKMVTNDTHITILDDLYTRTIARAHTDNSVSEEIPILRGMKNGDPSSPQRFTTTIKDVFLKK